MFVDDEDEFRLFGTRARDGAGRRLVAGPLEVLLKDGNLRSIRFRGHEVLRAVAFLVRDRDWGTCVPEITRLEVVEEADSFRVRYRVGFREPSGAGLITDAVIEGRATGSLEFRALSRAEADFETARAGFTVLHPLAGVVGRPVEVLHTGGTVENGTWPDLIEPWQPFKDIRAITHDVAPGIRARTQFLGDVFEMEDQRNWTDASFKTYVRPLALPWPYTLAADSTMEQSVRVDLLCEAGAQAANPRGGIVRLDREETDVAVPEIGISLRPDCAAGDFDARSSLGAVGAGHLIAHYDPLAGHGVDDLAAFARLKTAAGLPLTLELAVPCVRAPGDELAEIAADCRRAGLVLDSLFVCPSVDRQSTPPGSTWPDCPPLEEVYAGARAAFAGVRLGGGMMSYFTELNRKRVPADRLDYVSHTTCPIVHAADDTSVMQTFEALGDVVRSVRAIYPDKPYRIGPSTIAMRQNPYGAATKDNADLARIPMVNVDPRHNGDFGAAFALAYAATVVGARLELLTLSALTGPFGLIAGANEPTLAGGMRPIGRVIGEIGRLAGASVWRLRSDRPREIVGFGSRGTMLVANLTPEPVPVLVGWTFSSVRSICRNGGLSVKDGVIELGPYETAVVF